MEKQFAGIEHVNENLTTSWQRVHCANTLSRMDKLSPETLRQFQLVGVRLFYTKPKWHFRNQTLSKSHSHLFLCVTFTMHDHESFMQNITGSTNENFRVLRYRLIQDSRIF